MAAGELGPQPHPPTFPLVPSTCVRPVEQPAWAQASNSAPGLAEALSLFPCNPDPVRWEGSAGGAGFGGGIGTHVFSSFSSHSSIEGCVGVLLCTGDSELRRGGSWHRTACGWGVAALDASPALPRQERQPGHISPLIKGTFCTISVVLSRRGLAFSSKLEIAVEGGVWARQREGAPCAPSGVCAQPAPILRPPKGGWNAARPCTLGVHRPSSLARMDGSAAAH